MPSTSRHTQTSPTSTPSPTAKGSGTDATPRGHKESDRANKATRQVRTSTKTRARATSASHGSPASPAYRHSTQTGETAAPTLPITAPGQFGRVVVMDITPSEDDAIHPARVELGEAFTLTAQVFIEGRSAIGATAVLRNPHGKEVSRTPMRCVNRGLDRWEATLRVGEHSEAKPWEPRYSAVKRQLGDWSVTIEGWEDPYQSWLHDARIKVRVDDDTDNALRSGSQLLERWADSASLLVRERRLLTAAAARLLDESLSTHDRLALASDSGIAALHAAKPLRDAVSASQPRTIRVERPKSSFTAWYQFFPRSEGAHYGGEGRDGNDGHGIVQGTLATSVTGLERAASQGFDVVYLPPIFPIGVTNRKGRNNALVAGPHDPGSPFGIGSPFGGHDTVDPLLGTMEDFTAFTATAHRLGLEIALDFALQCSPDHPWVRQHPEWFRHKPDGSIAFAENPPKKYQDIYPIDFNADMPGIEREVVRILNLWIDAGVTIFRIDNPHTKPVRFWQDVIAAVTAKHPEILFLAEAFTRPGMMRALSYVGFTQSHCYFPWRNTREELEEYLALSNGDGAFYQHNTFWPTTPDILTAYVRDNGIAGHAVRAVLAAMGSPSWGIYNGYELIENKQRDGFEEQVDNEKYEVKVRDWSKAEGYGISTLLGALNAIRRRHPSCMSYHSLRILDSSNPSVLAFARHVPAHAGASGKADTLIVVVNLDGHHANQAMVRLDRDELELGTGEIRLHEELTGRDFTWGDENFVSLAPWADVAHILSVRD